MVSSIQLRLFLSCGLVTLSLSSCGPKDSKSDVTAIEDDQCYSPLVGHPTAAERSQWITDNVQHAQDAERLHGIPAGALLSMSAQEGGYGFTKTALNANNPFGFKYNSSSAAGGRDFYTLNCQPATDPGNQYISFASMREAFLFVGERLAQNARYKGATDSYKARGSSSVLEASNEWIDGIANAGYNYSPSTYKQVIRKISNNYMAPSLTFSITYNTYKFSGGATASAAPAPATSTVYGITSPAHGATVRGNVAVTVNSSATDVKLFSRAMDSTDEWFLITSDSSAPFNFTWETSTYVPNGAYDLKAEVYNGATLLGTSTVSVFVSN